MKIAKKMILSGVNNIRKWYHATYPDDSVYELIDNKVTFTDLINKLGKEDIYELLGVGDSVLRERVFDEIAVRKNIDYDDVYDAWVNDKPLV